MGVAPLLQRQPRSEAGIGLPQIHPCLLCQSNQLCPCPLVKPGVGGIGDVLFHHCGIDRHALHAIRVDGTGFLPGLNGLGQQPFAPLFADPFTPAGQRGRIDGCPVLKEYLAREMLVIRVFDPGDDDRFIRQAIRVMKLNQASHQPRWCRRTPRRRWEKPGPFPLEHLPVNQRRELGQFMTRIDHVDQSWTQQVILFCRAFAMLHWRIQIARFLPKSYKTLQADARKSDDFMRKTNRMKVVQSELVRAIRKPSGNRPLNSGQRLVNIFRVPYSRRKMVTTPLVPPA
jgi:hypothetical protein